MTPLLLGHRGARAVRQIPENTLASFELCLQHGCDGFEFDVRLSSDGQVVVCHDPMAHGMEIAETSASDLALPTLDEVFRQFSSRAFLDIELKVGGLEKQVVELLSRYPPQKGYLVSSFLLEVLRGLHGVDASVPLGFLCEERNEIERWRELSVAWVLPRWDLVDRELGDQVKAAGKKVMVWTVNRPKQMRQLAEWGVDGVITDNTELAIHASTLNFDSF
jgi:glycerophosphoryl diester phosphodiesterase